MSDDALRYKLLESMVRKTSAEEGAVPELIAICKAFECCMTPMLLNVFVYSFKLLVLTTPVNEGSWMGALRLKAFCVAVEIVRSEGDVFDTLPKPIIAGVIPFTAP